MEGLLSEGVLALKNAEGGESPSESSSPPVPLAPKQNIKDRIKVFNNERAATDLPRNASPLRSPMRGSPKAKVRPHQEEPLPATDLVSIEPVANGDDHRPEPSVADDDENDDEEPPPPPRGWRVKRIMSNKSYRRENPSSSYLASSDDSEEGQIEETKDTTLPHDNGEAYDGEDKEQERPVSSRPWTVERAMSNESSLHDQIPGPSSEPLTFIATPIETPSDGNDSAEADCGDEAESPRRSWTVKRVVSNDEYCRENPESFASLGAAPEEPLVNNVPAAPSCSMTPIHGLLTDRKMTPKTDHKSASVLVNTVLTPKGGVLPYKPALKQAITPKRQTSHSEPAAITDEPDISTLKVEGTPGSKPGWLRKVSPKWESSTPQMSLPKEASAPTRSMGPTVQPLTFIATPIETPSDGNNSAQADCGDEPKSPRRSWTVKRVMSKDEFCRENPDSSASLVAAPEEPLVNNVPGPSVQPLTFIATPIETPSDGNHSAQADCGDEPKSPRRSWTVKRVMSKDEFCRENPESSASLVAAPEEPLVNNFPTTPSCSTTPMHGLLTDRKMIPKTDHEYASVSVNTVLTPKGGVLPYKPALKQAITPKSQTSNSEPAAITDEPDISTLKAEGTPRSKPGWLRKVFPKWESSAPQVLLPKQASAPTRSMGPSVQPLTFIATPLETPSDGNYCAQGDCGDEAESPRRSWTVKRVVSNDELCIENPESSASLVAAPEEPLVNNIPAAPSCSTTPKNGLLTDRKMTPKTDCKSASVLVNDVLTPKRGVLPYKPALKQAITPKRQTSNSKQAAITDEPDISTPKVEVTPGSKPGWLRKVASQWESSDPQALLPNEASAPTRSITPTSALGNRRSLLTDRLNHFQSDKGSSHSTSTVNSTSTVLSAATTGLEGRLRSPRTFRMNASTESNPMSQSSHTPSKKLSLGVGDVTKARQQTTKGKDKQKKASPVANPATVKEDLDLEEFAEGDEYADLEHNVVGQAEKATDEHGKESSLPESLPLGSLHSTSSSCCNDSVASICSEEGVPPKVRSWKVKRVVDAETYDRENTSETPEGRVRVDEDHQPKRSWKVKKAVSTERYQEENLEAAASSKSLSGAAPPEPRAITSPSLQFSSRTAIGPSHTGDSENGTSYCSVQQRSMSGRVSQSVGQKIPVAIATGSEHVPSLPKKSGKDDTITDTFAPAGFLTGKDAMPSEGGSALPAPGESSVIIAVPSLKDRIGMFNKNSTVPDFVRLNGKPGFLNPKHMKKLVVVQEEDETKGTKDNGDVAESAPAPARVKSQKRGSDLMPAKMTIIEQNRVPLRSQSTIKDLLPPPTKSLDVKQNEVVERKLERFNSFQNRRGRLRASRSALLGQKSATRKDVFMPVAAKQVGDLSTFKPPKFPKDGESIKIIKSALSKNFVFEDLKDDEFEQFVMAFEQVKLPQGEIIMKQGDVGDYFYVVAYGEVSVHVNEKKVGIIKAGNSFGEMSLLYTCPRAATVIAESQPTRLFRVDQKTFRYMMQAQTKKSEEKKEQLLRNITFLEHLSAEDIHRLCSVMTPCLFSTGDYIVKRGERGDSFYVIQEGKVRVTDILVGNIQYEDVTLEAGDYFGEGALISSESRAANVVALTKGTAFAIDRKTFQKVIGDFVKLISKAQDRQRLEGIKVLRDADLTAEHINELASHLVDKEFEAKSTIFKEGQTVEGALYIVREGTLKISSLDGNRSEEIVPGGYFGQEQLLADIKGKRVNANYSVVVGDDLCVCGILTLKDCRSVFDTTAMEEGSYTGGSSYKLSKRQKVKEAIKKTVSLDTMKKECILGEGQFAEVWLVSADLPLGHQEFAMKIQYCDDEVRQDDALESIRREITVLQQLHHPFIIDLVATFDKDDGSIYMLMEAVKGGELWGVVHQQGEDGEWKSGLSESHAKFYSLLMADTLAYMHREKFIFRDLKPENVLIDEEGYPIIVDFGFAKYCPDKTYTFCGTPNYLAPEIVTNRGHGAGVDHWALGVVTYEMITGENPFYFEDMNQMALFQAIVQEPMFPPGDDASPELIDFLSGLLEKDPIQRLGMLAGRERDVLRHKWFADLDFDKMRNKEAKAPWLPKTMR